jgi:hypothetical protein
MSRWAQTRRRGGAKMFGLIAPPGPTDWSWAQDGAGELVATRLITQPPPSTQWAIRYREQGTPTWTDKPATSGNTITVTGLTTGHTYEGQACWWSGTARISEFSTTKTAIPA